MTFYAKAIFSLKVACFKDEINILVMRQRPRDCVYMREDGINVVLHCNIIQTNLVSVCRCVRAL